MVADEQFSLVESASMVNAWNPWRETRSEAADRILSTASVRRSAPTSQSCCAITHHALPDERGEDSFYHRERLLQILLTICRGHRISVKCSPDGLLPSTCHLLGEPLTVSMMPTEPEPMTPAMTWANMRLT